MQAGDGSRVRWQSCDLVPGKSKAKCRPTEKSLDGAADKTTGRSLQQPSWLARSIKPGGPSSARPSRGRASKSPRGGDLALMKTERDRTRWRAKEVWDADDRLPGVARSEPKASRLQLQLPRRKTGTMHVMKDS